MNEFSYSDKCIVEGCDRPKASTLGYCSKHIQQWRKHGKINKETERNTISKNSKCSIKNCEIKVYAKGLCQYHYMLSKKPNGICKIDDCNARIITNGLCSKHYQKTLKIKKDNKNISEDEIIHQLNKMCNITGCYKLATHDKYCDSHYNRNNKKRMDDINMEREYKICSVEGCNKKHKALGYCDLHYQQYKKYGDIIKQNPEKIILKKDKECLVEGCVLKVKANGYCGRHYKQSKKYGRILNDYEYYKVCHSKCIVQDCENKVLKLGYCKEHYNKYFGVDNMNNESNETTTVESVVTKSPVKIDNPNENILPDKEIFKCDKCGEDINNNNISNMKFTPFKDSSTIELNLCHKCSSNLIKWMLKRQ